MEWLSKYLAKESGFVRPDWESISSHIDSLDLEKQSIWCDISEEWVKRIAEDLPEGYRIAQSENFILLTKESEKYVSLFIKYLERTRVRILRTLEGIARDDGYGKHVVLIFDEIDHYYSYLSYYYPEEGEFGLSSGVYINNGYGHYAFPHQELSIAEPIAVHEMTHALISHLPIPGWLNEGIAVSVENEITGSRPLRMDDEMYAKHMAFWGSEEIQEFWSGDSFYRVDDGQELSYDLAQFSVHLLSGEYEDFKAFVNKAHYSDGGEAAANEVYEGSLGNLILQFFGEGDWEPRPEQWTKKSDGR